MDINDVFHTSGLVCKYVTFMHESEMTLKYREYQLDRLSLAKVARRLLMGNIDGMDRQILLLNRYNAYN